MTPLFQKSLNTLEFPQVLRLLSKEAQSQPGASACLALLPKTDPEDVRELLTETEDAGVQTRVRGIPDLGGVTDIRETVQRARLSGTLSCAELLAVRNVLYAASSAIAWIERDSAEATSLDGYFLQVSGNKFLEQRIGNSILSEDAVADSASPDLRDIRRKILAAGENVRRTLNKIISSPTQQKHLREPIITVKNDRFVVPVKQESRGQLPGIIHEVSSSGATVFVEPMSVVEINNEIRTLKSKEQDEIERILAELTAEVAEHGESLLTDCAILIQLDVIFAKARFSERLNASCPEVTDGEIALYRCRHPLIPSSVVVPTDILLGGDFAALIITGPNTGGKTVALKTLGLFCAMAAAGLHIPCSSGSRIAVFERILADIGDEQSIEQSLSTFSSHMVNIVSILGELDYRTLALFDELGAGTDPQEGAALAIAIIEETKARGALLAVTTHYSELKTYALETPGAINASCEFDTETLRPTYRLLVGVPGRSNAFSISKRLGLPDTILDKAQSLISQETHEFEAAVGKLAEISRIAEDNREASEELRKNAERDSRLAAKMRRDYETKTEKFEKAAREKAQRIIEDARAQADEIFDELKQLRHELEEEKDALRLRGASDEGSGHEEYNNRKSGILRRLGEAEDGIYASTRPQGENRGKKEKIRPGDRVELLKYGTEADVVAVNGRKLELNAGAMRVTADVSEVRLAAPPQSKKEPEKKVTVTVTRAPSGTFNSELDLRGKTTDDAVALLEKYIDEAKLRNLTSVTIIHGKGTGAVRRAVTEHLKADRTVRFRLGRFGEGEDGVTVVELK
ncbi:MAG: endonuclease MutS2 [Oscillospiraceae bacterium]|jgi:DNA mismatch repair protein MutS2|nr:endonuclease MutS2 [Oscillospiraceae bacterium]